MALPVQVALTAGVNFFSAFVQASTGFGYALVAMPLMALFLSMKSCSAISAVTIIVIGLQMSIKLRDNLRVSTIAIPMVCCLGTINIGLSFLGRFNELLLRIILAALLVAVAGFSLLRKNSRVHRANSWIHAVAAGLLTGISAGMFNVVGPFLALYYLGVCDDLLHLKASLEFSFLLAGLYSATMHLFVYQTINTSVAPHILASVAAALCAGFIGIHLYKKLNRDVIALLVYILLPVMAAVLILDSLI